MNEECPSPSPEWRIGVDRVLSLDEPRIMGIVNATPDSFSDGGAHRSCDALIDHALRLIEDGASILDVGGESTRPGASRVESSEQIARVLPVIQGVRWQSDVPISIDTTRTEVARAALDAGANIINDVSAGREDESMFLLAAERAAGIMLMHRLRPPDEDQYSHSYASAPVYDDVVADVLSFLLARCRAADAAGIARESIVIDPGLGFGKSVEQNLELIARTSEFVAAGYPVLSGVSRKSFLGRATGMAAPAERDVASTAVSVIHFGQGVRLFRVHNVRMHRDALAVAGAISQVGNNHAPMRV